MDSQSIIPAGSVIDEPQPPVAFAGCPFLTEVGKLWGQITKAEYKEAVVLLVRTLADRNV